MQPGKPVGYTAKEVAEKTGQLQEKCVKDNSGNLPIDDEAKENVSAQTPLKIVKEDISELKTWKTSMTFGIAATPANLPAE